MMRQYHCSRREPQLKLKSRDRMKRDIVIEMDGTTSLSEFESKELLSSYGLQTSKESLVYSSSEAKARAVDLGYPVVLKICGRGIAHKTEIDGIRLNIQNESDLVAAVEELAALGGENPEFLISEQVLGVREFIAGYHVDPDFGPVIMFGLGGIFTELISDVNFRLLPCKRRELQVMIHELETSALLGEFRGEQEISIDTLLDALEAISHCGLDDQRIVSIDVNPIIISNGHPIAVDALVVKS